MKNNNKQKHHLCEACEKRIEEYGYMCVEFMQEVCKNAYQGGEFYCHELHSPMHVQSVTRFLELKSYLVSKELQEDVVVIRPNLRTGVFNSEKNVFCWCVGDGQLA